MADYRNYGALHESTAPQVPVVTDTRTQVYKDTHDGAGNRLPLMERSFISFTYGGKHIEDFDLVSVIDGDRLNRALYGTFADDTTTYNTVDGQFYWGTNYERGELDLVLATDGMTEKELHEFKQWFQPGVSRELILAENPNRAIMARVATVPQYNVIPFEQKTSIVIAGNTYQTKTTLYKGDISLQFVMDDPFWYSIKNIIPLNVTNANGVQVRALEDKDTLKIILEDKVPYISMLAEKVILGDGVYTSSRKDNDIERLNAADMAYLYYAGTAPGQTVVQFTFTPKLEGGVSYIENLTAEVAIIGQALIGSSMIGKDYSGDTAANQLYIKEPRNYIYKEEVDTSSNEYNYLMVGDKIFKFTTPGIYTGYNQALKIFSQFQVGDSIVDIRTAIRDGVKEYYTRAWAMAVVKYLSCTDFVDSSMNVKDYTVNGKVVSFHYILNKLMWYFLIDKDTQTYNSATVTFDSKTGEAVGHFRINAIPVNTTWAGEPVQGDYFNEFRLSATSRNIAENIGDMVYDKYLILEGQNMPNAGGTITAEDCSNVTTDYENGLNNLSISYKHEYL